MKRIFGALDKNLDELEKTIVIKSLRNSWLYLEILLFGIVLYESIFTTDSSRMAFFLLISSTSIYGISQKIYKAKLGYGDSGEDE